MNPERWRQIDEILEVALEEDESRRAAFLDEACAGDEALRSEIESLLRADRESGELLETPAMELAARSLAREQLQSATGRKIGSYQILSPLGLGGMGEVYLAEDGTLERKVALKFLSQVIEEDAAAQGRFLREAKMAAALDHPFICKVYEIGEEEGKPFISMEYIRGQTLRRRMDESKPQLREALDIALEIGEALAEAHERGIMHRDLKPANIMITPQGHVKVMDFGLAKRVTSAQDLVTQMETFDGLTRPGTAMGTLAYMSPEQLRGEKLDTRSDVFSFGILLHELISGVHPFLKPHAMETASSILRDEPAGLAAAPEELEKILGKMMAKRPEDRYQSADQVLDALHQIRRRLSLEEPWYSKPLPLTLAALLLVATFVLVWQIASPPSIPIRELSSVAILPLINLGDESDYLALGISRGVTGRLDRAGLRVTPWETVLRYHGTRKLAVALAADLQRDAVLTGTLAGTLQGPEDLLLAEVSLIDGETGFAVWTNHYERPFDDLLLLEAEIARDVARQMKGKLSLEEEKILATGDSNSVNAYDFFLQGSEELYRGTRSSTASALRYFERAQDEDPDMALAHVGLGAAYYDLFFNGWDSTPEVLERAENSFNRALYLDGKNLDARRGLMHIHWERGETVDILELGRKVRDVIPIDRQDDPQTLLTIGWSYLLADLDELALDLLREVLTKDPANPSASWGLAVWGWGGEGGQAARAYINDFGDDDHVYVFQGFGQLEEGALQEARNSFAKAAERANDSTDATEGDLTGLFLLGLVSEKLDMAAEALEAWNEGVRLVEQDLQSDQSNIKRRIFLACFYGLLNRHEEFEQQKQILLEQISVANPPLKLFDLQFLVLVLARVGKTQQASELLRYILDDGRLGMLPSTDIMFQVFTGSRAPLEPRVREEILAVRKKLVQSYGPPPAQ